MAPTALMDAPNQTTVNAGGEPPYPVRLHDCAPPPEDLHAALRRGLRAEPKHISCKYFYDERGSHLFDQICELEEYYPTRTERNLLCGHGEEMAHLLGPERLLLEYGSGSGAKTGILLDKLIDTGNRPAAYVPID